jgi:hypothetical protein
MSADEKHPTLKNGKICYLEMPAADIETSARFSHESRKLKLDEL